MSGDEIGDWTASKSFHPVLALHVVGPAPDVLQILASSLRGSRYRISEYGPTGFRATHLNWLAVAQLERARTRLAVEARAGAGTTEVTVRVVSGGSLRLARRRAAVGLTAATAELRRRGMSVTVTPWLRPEA